MRFGLEENITEKITRVLEDQPKVDKAYIFGSRAKGDYRPDSDIDIAVKGYDLTVEDILKMSAVIDKSGIGHEVDLVDYDSIKEQALKDHIDRAGSEFFARWKEYNLGDVITLKRGYDLPKQNRTVGTIPIYSSAGITDYNNLIAKEGPGVITGRYGTIGEVFYCNSSYWPLNTTLYVSDFKGNYPKFAYYLLKKLDFEKYSDKSAVPGVNRNEIHKEIVHIPPHIDQVKIAEVLTSIDDKINLLNRQNKTLESIAEIMFRQHFSQDKKSGTIGEYIKVQGGFAFPSQTFKDQGSERVLKITNISMGFVDILNTQFVDNRVTASLDISKFRVKSGDFLIAMTGAEIGKIGMVEMTEALLWLNQRVGKLCEKVPYGNLVGYLALKSREGQEHISNACSGSAQENISTTGIEEMEFVQYCENQARSFGEEVQTLFEKKIRNLQQIRVLSTLRDTLLPKLLSGEARVKMS